MSMDRSSDRVGEKSNLTQRGQEFRDLLAGVLHRQRVRVRSDVLIRGQQADPTLAEATAWADDVLDTIEYARQCADTPLMRYVMNERDELATEVKRLREAISAAEHAILGDGTHEADLQLHEALTPLWEAADPGRPT